MSITVVLKTMDTSTWTRFKALSTLKGTCATKAIEAMVTAQVASCSKVLNKLEGIVGNKPESVPKVERLDIEDYTPLTGHAVNNDELIPGVELESVIEDGPVSPETIEEVKWVSENLESPMDIDDDLPSIPNQSPLDI